jgi:hypothetical protein
MAKRFRWRWLFRGRVRLWFWGLTLAGLGVLWSDCMSTARWSYARLGPWVLGAGFGDGDFGVIARKTWGRGDVSGIELLRSSPASAEWRLKPRAGEVGGVWYVNIPVPDLMAAPLAALCIYCWNDRRAERLGCACGAGTIWRRRR